VVILGAGFGGLELSTRLSDELADDVAVTLIDKSDSFTFGFKKLDVLFGRATLESVRLPYREIAKPSVTFKQETITSIDPEARRVVTDGGTYDADILVVALGADLDPAATPGLLEGGYEFYSPEGAAVANEALSTLTSGTAMISVLGTFFKCPPAPNEAAFMLHDLLVKRGVRDACSIVLTSPLPRPIPPAPDVSATIIGMLAERNIDYRPSMRVVSLDPTARVAHFEDGSTQAYDLFLGIPVHCAPRVVAESTLSEDDGWIAVDRSCATKFPNVYAIGDVTLMPVPRAGVVAEGEARTLADVLIAQLTGGPEPEPYMGDVVCYLDMGDDTVARVDVNFLRGDAITADYNPPSLEIAAQKDEFGSSRARRWFGR
jgi:sulfide:quinone oxidoreductase